MTTEELANGLCCAFHQQFVVMKPSGVDTGCLLSSACPDASWRKDPLNPRGASRDQLQTRLGGDWVNGPYEAVHLPGGRAHPVTRACLSCWLTPKIALKTLQRIQCS